MRRVKLGSGTIYVIPQIEIERIGYFYGDNEDIRYAHTRLERPDFLFNCAAYDISTGSPLSDIVSGGIIERLSDDYGMAFDGKKSVFSYQNKEGFPDYVGFYPTLLHDGRSLYHSDPDGFAIESGRTAIAVDNMNNLYIALVPNAHGITMESLTNALLNAGATNGGNLDNGASSQWISPGGEEYTGRPLRGFIGIWVNKCGVSRLVDVRNKLNIRSSPPNYVGINLSPVIGIYRDGERVIVLEQKAGWSRTARGWVFSGYLKNDE